MFQYFGGAGGAWHCWDVLVPSFNNPPDASALPFGGLRLTWAHRGDAHLACAQVVVNTNVLCDPAASADPARAQLSGVQARCTWNLVVRTASTAVCGAGGAEAAVGAGPAARPHALPESPTLVRTKSNGFLQGGLSRSGKTRFFLGIQYATAERWKPPRAVVSAPQDPATRGLVRGDPQNATMFGPSCWQQGGVAAYPQSEHCLNLNVFAPVVPPPRKDSGVPRGHPVLFWIHGGCYDYGTANQRIGNGTNLVERFGDVVVVSINYRLSAFGFLGSDALRGNDLTESTGNYGLLDQREAMRWVQNNIAAFGGDPTRVMIFGQSAGAGSVAPATKSDLEVLEELEPGVSRPLPPQLLPYFEGDFWPWEGEQVLKNLIKEDIKRAQDEEEKRFFESSDGTRRPRKTRRKVSTLAAGVGAGSAIDMTKPLQKIGDSTVVGGASADGPAAAGDTGKDALDESTVAALPAAKQELETQRLMRKLANMMEHMKPDFLVCKLKHTCSRCNHYILNGPRYFCRTCESVGKPFNLCEGCHAAEAKRAESGEACVSLHRNHTTKMRTDAELQLGSKKHERRAYSDKNKNLVVELNDIVIEHKKKNREAAAPKAPAPKADTPAGRVVAGAKEVEAIARQAKLRANKKRAKKRAEARQAGGADATGASLGPNGYHSGGGATSALKRANLENIIRVMSVGHDGEEEAAAGEEEEDAGEVDEDEQERRAAIPPHRLEKAEEATKEDTVDSDEKMDCPILNSRLALLGVCQGNRYQFDQKRRAKHSSMMLLYHLHNPKVPLYVHTCNECQKDILGDCRYNCKTCPDFDLCARCYRDVHHIHALKRIPVDVSGTGTEDQEERKQRSLALFLDSLVHTTSCRGCSRPECKKMRELLDHREKCRRRASGGCDTCQRILCLLQIHARRCKNEDCKVLYCNVLKKRIAQSNARKKKKAKADAPPSTSGSANTSTSGSANTSTAAEKEKERPEGTGVAV